MPAFDYWFPAIICLGLLAAVGILIHGLVQDYQDQRRRREN